MALIRPHRPVRSSLAVGERYICDLGDRGERLVDVELVAIEDWVGGAGDGRLRLGGWDRPASGCWAWSRSVGPQRPFGTDC